MKTTILSLADRIPTEAAAYEHLESLRWPDGVKCVHCGGENVSWITPMNGVSRKVTNGTMSQRRVWQCRPCRKQFSAISGTFMHGTKASVRLWVLVIFDMISAKNGISAREVERKYGVCPTTAWFICHRVREAMANMSGLLSGNVSADETYIGGDPKNRHATDRVSSESGYGRGRGTDKTPVVSLINAETGQARSKVIASVDGATLIRVMREYTDGPMTHLHTDALQSYKMVATFMASHHYVDHSKGEYVSDKSLGTNLAEGFFSQLKRSLDGTHHHVSVEHLQRYVSEFDFRRSTCKVSDVERMAQAVRQGDGRRMSYKRLKAPTQG